MKLWLKLFCCVDLSLCQSQAEAVALNSNLFSLPPFHSSFLKSKGPSLTRLCWAMGKWAVSSCRPRCHGGWAQLEHLSPALELLCQGTALPLCHIPPPSGRRKDPLSHWGKEMRLSLKCEASLFSRTLSLCCSSQLSLIWQQIAVLSRMRSVVYL